MIRYIVFILAVILITVAHLVRVIRWEMFIKVYEKPQRGNLIMAIAWAYLLNYIVPFKLGDILRAYISGKKMKSGKSLGFSTVIIDRYLDVLSVGFIFGIFALNNIGGVVSRKAASTYIILAVAFLASALIIFCLRGSVKRLLKGFAGIFNSKIEVRILKFSWSLIWNFKDIFQKLSVFKLTVYTVIMWCCYIVSYFFFAEFLSLSGNAVSWSNIFMLLFAQNGLKDSTAVTTLFNTQFAGYSLFFVLYMLVPLGCLFLIAKVYHKRFNASINEDEVYLNLFPHLDERERLKFLENYFSNDNNDYIQNYLKVNQGISIIRDFSAGSNATTMLCMDDEKTFFRKYAFEEDGEKLYQQILWLEANKDRLVFPEIIKKEKTDTYCYYDMPYNPNAVGLFEYAHSMPVDKAWGIIQKVLKSLEESIYKVHVRSADIKTIEKYITFKVDKNIERIKNGKYIKRLLKYDKVIINGIEYNNFHFYEKYLTKDYLAGIFAKDEYSVIHGDLTIENIICTRDEMGNDDFYIIDPNTGNIHDSPNLDYAKLLQSIHGGYEFLMTTKEIKVSENRINFLVTRSSAYKELYSRLRTYMKESLGEERTRSIYFHEIIHWLRLMPYKIEKDGIRSVLFYAGMLIVMNDVIEMYGEK